MACKIVIITGILIFIILVKGDYCNSFFILDSYQDPKLIEQHPINPTYKLLPCYIRPVRVCGGNVSEG